MSLAPLERVRNIGIIAHIDAGKTTTSERFLYYAGLTHRIGEVHDGEAFMDHREDERQRGITISAAATSFLWNDHQVNLIDTPGHVDFTAEVERSLRVLDGAVVIFSGVEGVEPQSETVWHQADRYGVPRLAFINKLDRVGADHERVMSSIRQTLGATAIFVNLPHGLESDLDGVLDLIRNKWLVFDPSTRGRELEAREIPDEAREIVASARDAMIEGVAEVVDWLAEKYLGEEEISEAEIVRAIREATLAGDLVPVLCGSSLKDLGIRPILDAVCDFLPSPLERPPAQAHDPKTSEPIEIPLSPDEPFSALVFKVVADQNTDYHWIRVYSGSMTTEDRTYNPRTGTRLRLRRLMRLHGGKTEKVDRARCGDIVAATGLKDVVTGDTFCDPDRPVAFESIFFPETVVSVAVEARTSAERDKLLQLVERLSREDPTFTSHTDPETGQLILSGMGELHLEVIQKRMERDFNVSARFGRPRVSYRETIVESGRGDATFDKVLGEARVFARAVVEVEPRPRDPEGPVVPPVEVEVAGAVSGLSAELQAEALDLLRSGCLAGGTMGYPMMDVRARLERIEIGECADPLVPLGAAISLALHDAFAHSGTSLLEPIMKLEARVPEDGLGAVVKDLGSRRAEIQETGLIGNLAFVRGTVPLSEMFGYSTSLRSKTQGRGSFSLELYDYRVVPERVLRQDSLIF